MDYWGTYTFDLATGAILLEVTGLPLSEYEELQAGFITLPPGVTELRHDFEVGGR